MEALKRSREETEKARQEAGIVDSTVSINDNVAATSIKGKGKVDDANAGPAPKVTGRGIDKRKRDLEERRKAIEAKRRKTNGPSSGASISIPAESEPPVTSAAHSAAPDPSNKGGADLDASSTAADDFLTKLEADLLKR
jgi:hypothetical protein